MDFRPWGSGSRKTLVVLGAGASFGAKLGENEDGLAPRLPLDLGFFSELQRLTPDRDTRSLLAFVREEFGSTIGFSMEEFFSEVEYTGRFHDEVNVDRGRKITRYSKALTAFYCSLPRLFREAVNGRECHWHGSLAELLSALDVVISFNYDCLMDTALKKHANRQWDPSNGRDGYGFQCAGGTADWVHHHGKGAAPQSSIKLLKPHGSLNWKIDENSKVTLETAPYDIATAEGRIIPPTWFKNLQQEPFASVWKQARLEIRSSRAIVAIGYSVPPTDLFSRALFKAEAGSKQKREKLDFLVLVNPDPAARARFANLVRGGIVPDTRVLEFSHLEDFVLSLNPKAAPVGSAAAQSGYGESDPRE